MSAFRVSSAEELASFVSNDSARVVVRHESSLDAIPYIEAIASSLGTDVRVLCANASTVVQLQADGIDGARTIQDAALELIYDPRVANAIGRDARVLDANEFDVLMEDMKVTGIKGRRLREMFKFFCKSLSEGAPDDPTWLVNDEERKQYAILEENLEARRALLPAEVCYRALRGVEAVPEALVTAPTVIEDFGAMGACAQELALALAGGQRVVFVREGGSHSADEPYPHEAGVSELLSGDLENVQIVSEKPEPERTVQACARPTDEFAFVARRVAGLIDGGASPESILIAVPNRVWGNRIASELAHADIPTVLDLGPQKVKGDPRYPGTCGKLKLAALVKLVADPEDFTALRSWCGTGDWLVRSDAFLELLAYAREHGTGTRGALRELHGSTQASELQLFHKIEGPLDQLDAIRAADEEGNVEALRAALAEAGAELSETQKAALADGGLGALAKAAVETPAPGSRTSHAVRIASYPRCHTLVAPHIIACGLVEGFLPAAHAIDDSHSIDHKAKAIVRERQLFDDVCARATKTLTLSYFTEDRIENTEKLPMQVQRIRVKHGARYAQLAKSQFITA